MNKIRNAFAVIIFLCAAQTTLGQSADWVSLFRELVSPDPSVSETARMRSFTELIPALETRVVYKNHACRDLGCLNYRLAAIPLWP